MDGDDPTLAVEERGVHVDQAVVHPVAADRDVRVDEEHAGPLQQPVATTETATPAGVVGGDLHFESFGGDPDRDHRQVRLASSQDLEGDRVVFGLLGRR